MNFIFYYIILNKQLSASVWWCLCNGIVCFLTNLGKYCYCVCQIPRHPVRGWSFFVDDNVQTYGRMIIVTVELFDREILTHTGSCYLLFIVNNKCNVTKLKNSLLFTCSQQKYNITEE